MLTFLTEFVANHSILVNVIFILLLFSALSFTVQNVHTPSGSNSKSSITKDYLKYKDLEW